MPMHPQHGALPMHATYPARGGISGSDPQQRHRLIQEAAYSLYERGGFVHGHDADDWLAAEAYIDATLTQARRYEAAQVAVQELQQSGTRSVARDEALKRIVRQHPLRDFARVESVEPRDATGRNR